jgi:hypothetical protein
MIHTLALHLLFTVIISLSCIGINATTWRDMVFAGLADRIEKYITGLIGFHAGCALCKPLFRCPMCMASFWSLLFWLICGMVFNPVLMILTVCGLNVVLVSLIINIMPDE